MATRWPKFCFVLRIQTFSRLHWRSFWQCIITPTWDGLWKTAFLSLSLSAPPPHRHEQSLTSWPAQKISGEPSTVDSTVTIMPTSCLKSGFTSAMFFLDPGLPAIQIHQRYLLPVLLAQRGFLLVIIRSNQKGALRGHISKYFFPIYTNRYQPVLFGYVFLRTCTKPLCMNPNWTGKKCAVRSPPLELKKNYSFWWWLDTCELSIAATAECRELRARNRLPRLREYVYGLGSYTIPSGGSAATFDGKPGIGISQGHAALLTFYGFAIMFRSIGRTTKTKLLLLLRSQWGSAWRKLNINQNGSHCY